MCNEAIKIQSQQRLIIYRGNRLACRGVEANWGGSKFAGRPMDDFIYQGNSTSEFNNHSLSSSSSLAFDLLVGSSSRRKCQLTESESALMSCCSCWIVSNALLELLLMRQLTALERLHLARWMSVCMWFLYSILLRRRLPLHFCGTCSRQMCVCALWGQRSVVICN